MQRLFESGGSRTVSCAECSMKQLFFRQVGKTYLICDISPSAC
jgi:hypothetical protein